MKDLLDNCKEKVLSLKLNVCATTKKNSSQLIFVKGKPRIIPSKKYREFEQECLWQITGTYKKRIDYPINIKAIFYMQSKRKVDLTNLLEALDDMLVKAEVIADDNRDIIASHDGSLVLYDKTSPRIEVEIERKERYEQWKKT